MSPIWTRFLRDGEMPQFLAWARANTKNHFSEDEVRDYTILVAIKDNKILCFMPVKKALRIESLAPNPDCTPIELAGAMRELVMAANLTADGLGCKEIDFWDSDAGTTRAAQLIGFEPCSMTLLRRRI